MYNGTIHKCDQCGVESKGMRIGLTTDPVTKHFCTPNCFVAYCDKHKRLQNSLAYAMYKDLIDSTESIIPHNGGQNDP